MKLKFVSAAKPTDYADRLHAVQTRIRKLEGRLKALEAEEKQLQSYLMKFSQGQSFIFKGGDGFQKKFQVSTHTRMILDQDKVMRMLKSRTPYRESSWLSLRIDWVYEEKSK